MNGAELAIGELSEDVDADAGSGLERGGELGGGGGGVADDVDRSRLKIPIAI